MKVLLAIVVILIGVALLIFATLNVLCSLLGVVHSRPALPAAQIKSTAGKSDRADSHLPIFDEAR
jgi:hypothetical protein